MLGQRGMTKTLEIDDLQEFWNISRTSSLLFFPFLLSVSHCGALSDVFSNSTNTNSKCRWRQGEGEGAGAGGGDAIGRLARAVLGGVEK